LQFHSPSHRGILSFTAYGALFTKLWRVDRVLQFTRRQIKPGQVLWPLFLLLLGALCVLGLWTALDDLTWVRVEVEEQTGESIGLCTCDNPVVFLIPLLAFIVIPLGLTAIMASKTSDVDDAYSEGYWIYVLLIVQLEALVVAFPIVWILRDVSTDVRYFGFVVMLWIFPMSTIAIVVAPKIYNCIWGKGENSSQGRRRGERPSDIRASGMSSDGLTSNRRASLNGSHSVSQARDSDTGSVRGSYHTSESPLANNHGMTTENGPLNATKS
jgi:7 transmembrane sweet-taste receptor of 3 GCPR